MYILTELLVSLIKSHKNPVLTKQDVIDLVRDIDTRIEIPVLESRGIIIDPNRFIVTFNGNEIFFPRKEFQILYLLISNKNKTLRRYTILSQIWGSDVYVTERTIDVHIRKIRQKLNNTMPETYKGIGYIWKE